MPGRLTRRELAGLIVGSAVLAACGGAKKASSGSSPTPAHSAGTGAEPVVLHGTTVPVAQQVSVADSRRYAGLLDGRWRGGWHDSTGRSGDTDVTVRVDPRRRTATVTVSCSGDVLGSPIETETYVIDLASYRRSAVHWRVHSPQVGEILCAAQSGTSFTGAVSDVPNPAIRSIEAAATRTPGRVDVSYTLTQANGAPVHGTIAGARGAVRATPMPINNGSAPTAANVQSGAFAASLLTAAEVSHAAGQAFSAPTPNGGNVGYGRGIQISNALCKSVDRKLQVAYSVYIADSHAHAAAQWKNQLLGLPSVRGPWKAAFYLTSPPTLYAYSGTHIATVEVQPLDGAGATPRDREFAIAVGKELIRRLDR